MCPCARGPTAVPLQVQLGSPFPALRQPSLQLLRLAAASESRLRARGARASLRVLRVAGDVTPEAEKAAAVGGDVRGSGGGRVGAVPSAGTKVGGGRGDGFFRHIFVAFA